MADFSTLLRLSSFYFFYFGTLGVIVPYWGPYLSDRGLEAADIGVLFAVLNGTKIISPYVWGWVGDKGYRVRIIRLATLVAMISFAAVLIPWGYYWLLFLTIIYSFFWNACLPQFEAITLGHLEGSPGRYSRVRLWGSIGFIVSVIGVGYLIDAVSVRTVPYLALLLFVALWLISLLVKDHPELPDETSKESISQILKRREVIAFFVICFFIQASHGPFYAFYTLFMEQTGYGHTVIGYLWSIGVVAEIIVFLYVKHLFDRFEPHWLLLTVLVLGLFRWAVVALLPEIIWAQVVAQICHAATFGVTHSVAMYYLARFFPRSFQGRGQALYTSITFGVGIALGNYFAGMLWDEIGGRAVFGLSALCCLIAMPVVYWVRATPHERQPLIPNHPPYD